MENSPIFLDNNATTFTDPRVIDRMAELAKQELGNPASQHSFGRKSRKIVELARESLLSAVNACTQGMKADQLLFCASGTEANNLAVLGLPSESAGKILVSSIEHPSVLAAAQLAEKRGRAVDYIPCGKDGVIDVDWLERRLAQHSEPNSQGQQNVETAVALVAVMAANNETGVVQPVAAIGQLCRQANVRFHVDAVQCLTKMPVDFAAWQADSVTICAHKVHGPVGTGALIHRHGLELEPQTVGGFQQGAVRAGTESVWLPDAFAYAVKLGLEDTGRADRMKALRDQFELELQRQFAAVGLTLEIVGFKSERLPNTSCIAFPSISRQALQMALDMAGIACSTGSACESGSSTPSHVLQAMGLNEEIVQSALRFSFSAFSDMEQVGTAVNRITQCVRKIQKR